MSICIWLEHDNKNNDFRESIVIYLRKRAKHMNETQRFYKNPEHASEVQLTKKTRIGGGEFGEVFQVEIQIGGRERTFVLKEFKDRKGRQAEQYAAQAMENYQKLKNAGLKVFSTYRLHEDGRSVLMTSGHTEKFVCIGSNDGSRSLKDFPEVSAEQIESIQSFETLVRSMLEQSKKASEHELAIDADAFFFLVDRDLPEKVDFVVGDVDMVGETSDSALTFEQNNHAIYTAIYHFLKNNVTSLGEYKARLDEVYKEVTGDTEVPKVTEEEIRTLKKRK